MIYKGFEIIKQIGIVKGESIDKFYIYLNNEPITWCSSIEICENHINKILIHYFKNELFNNEVKELINDL